MLKKIMKIKHLGLYDNYAWGGNLPDFKQYNVIYGWNGTGKTTLSKLLWALNSGSHPDFPSLEYSIQDADGNTHTQGTSSGTPVRVFNSDFITDNVNFETQSSRAITVVLGEENKEIIDQIKADEQKLEEQTRDLNIATRNKDNAVSARGGKFTEIAKTIGQGVKGEALRTYKKPQAENEFKALNKKELLDEATLDTLSKSVSQPVLPQQAKFSLADVSDDLAAVIVDTKTLLETTVDAVVIDRLKENPDIAAWIETGLGLHTKHNNETCDFCGQPIEVQRITELTAHFNKADAELKAKVDELAEKLRPIYAAIDGLKPVDKMNIYQELRDNYKIASDNLAKQRDLALTTISNFVELIENKKLHTTEIIPTTVEPSLGELTKPVEQLNEIIAKHNEKTVNFEEQRKTDSKRIERHYLSTIYDEVKEFDGKIKSNEDEITKLTNGIEGDDENIGLAKLKKRIEENKAIISSKHKACELLNDQIKTFLGHDEITFGVKEDGSGYSILRQSKPAKSLSEGERTAIAFVFFITQLNDDFDIKNGIVVIDDPVSSLDANSQFQAFSFLKNATTDAKQLFLFTHNFDFLKLVLYWLQRNKKNRSLYMVKNTFSTTDNSRTAYIDLLDPALERYESEYHYLFNIIYNYESDGTIENAYKMPNIARKLLDSFLMFRVPKNCDTYGRLKELDFDEEKKTAIYKFVNDQSHITGSGFDPSLVPETQKCVKYLLELMETTFKEHYDFLIEAISQ